MKPKVYEEKFSGHGIRYAFQYSGTELYMRPYIKMVKGSQYDIMSSREYIEMHKPFYTESSDDRYVEYISLIGLTSLALLKYGCCIIHAAAVLLDGYCWLITAPPGVGKTTQYYNLKKLYGDQVEMICGDMPLLEKTAEGIIMIHPTPWNGKERIQGTKSAPLGGILLLKQGSKNKIRKLKPAESVFPVLNQLAVLPDTEEQALQIAALADHVLKHYPVWEMKNLGDLASSELAADTFQAYAEAKRHEI